MTEINNALIHKTPQDIRQESTTAQWQPSGPQRSD